MVEGIFINMNSKKGIIKKLSTAVVVALIGISTAGIFASTCIAAGNSAAPLTKAIAAEDAQATAKSDAIADAKLAKSVAAANASVEKAVTKAEIDKNTAEANASVEKAATKAEKEKNKAAAKAQHKKAMARAKAADVDARSAPKM